MRNTPIHFDEYNNEMVADSGTESLRGTTLHILRVVEGLRQALDDIQQTCQHPRGLTPINGPRTMHQCPICGYRSIRNRA